MIPKLVMCVWLHIPVIAGCALLHKKGCHDPAPSVAVVEVGGQVHEPRSIEITPDGLTLHRAILAAGGARESNGAQPVMNVNAETEADLRSFMATNRSLGKHDFHMELFATERIGGDGAQELGIEAEKTVTDAMAEELAEIHSAESALKALPKESVDRLKVASKYIGEVEEKIRLSNQLDGILSSSERDEHQQKLNEEIAKEKELFLRLSGMNMNVRSWRPSRGELLVALDRPTSDPPVRYYLPYELATSGLAGEIELRDGDAVEIVDIVNTELTLAEGQFFDSPPGIAIQGAVETPGVVDNVRTIGEVHATNPPTINDSRGVWVLVRPFESGKGQKIFVLPDRMVAADGAAANAPSIEGDVYTYTILPQVPIVLESLLVRSLDGVKRRCLDRLEEKHRQKRAERAMVRESATDAAKVQRDLSPIR